MHQQGGVEAIKEVSVFCQEIQGQTREVHKSQALGVRRSAPLGLLVLLLPLGTC
jgi:hypothetical protein